jgi:hypothetical protein
MSDQGDDLRRISAELQELNRKLEAGGLDAAGATELLERITAVAQEAAAAIERRAESLDD